jgi:hypothetical protein
VPTTADYGLGDGLSVSGSGLVRSITAMRPARSLGLGLYDGFSFFFVADFFVFGAVFFFFAIGFLSWCASGGYE